MSRLWGRTTLATSVFHTCSLACSDTHGSHGQVHVQQDNLGTGLISIVDRLPSSEGVPASSPSMSLPTPSSSTLRSSSTLARPGVQEEHFHAGGAAPQYLPSILLRVCLRRWRSPPRPRRVQWCGGRAPPNAASALVSADGARCWSRSDARQCVSLRQGEPALLLFGLRRLGLRSTGGSTSTSVVHRRSLLLRTLQWPRLRSSCWQGPLSHGCFRVVPDIAP